MALIRLKRGTTGGFIPTGLTFGEPAVNTTDGILYCGDTGGATVDMSGVLSFNGKTGHVLFSQIADDLTMNVTGLSASSGITGNTTLHVGSTASFDGNIILTDDAFIGVAADDERIIFDSNGNDIPDAGQLRNAQKEELVYNWIESMANDGSIR